jgi:hypothetical protein
VPRLVEHHLVIGQVQIDVERQQDVGAEQAVGTVSCGLVDRKATDRNSIHRKLGIPQLDAIPQFGVPRGRWAADAERSRGMLKVARQAQAVHGGFSEQRALRSGVHQQLDRLAVDARVDE